jgi:hypothetical protein
MGKEKSLKVKEIKENILLYLESNEEHGRNSKVIYEEKLKKLENYRLT